MNALQAGQHTVHWLRGCQLCSHCSGPDAALQCSEPTVAGALLAVPCAQARMPGGGCGPDATRMHWPAIEAHSHHTRGPSATWEQAA
jgi:hypothetical protein